MEKPQAKRAPVPWALLARDNQISMHNSYFSAAPAAVATLNSERTFNFSRLT